MREFGEREVKTNQANPGDGLCGRFFTSSTFVDNFPKWEILLAYGEHSCDCGVRIISRKRLNEFAEGHPEAKSGLDAWFHEARDATWANPGQVKAKFGNASVLKGNRVVFNVGGNKYRLIVKINYNYSVVYVRFVGTHSEYDRIDAEEI